MVHFEQGKASFRQGGTTDRDPEASHWPFALFFTATVSKKGSGGRVLQ
jgi:hypothetical protein